MKTTPTCNPLQSARRARSLSTSVPSVFSVSSVFSVPSVLSVLSVLVSLVLLSACQDTSTPPDADQDGYSPEAGDCDDTNPDIHPGMAERCNQLDDNCDGQIDEDVPYFTLYEDEDGDGFGSPILPAQACGASTGLSLNGGDCDDANAQIHPGAPEQPDSVDNDCDALIDELGTERFYRDADADGFGSPEEQRSEPTAGFVRSRGDCDDTNAQVRPGAPDQLADGIDQDCGGSDGPQPHVGLSSTSQAKVQDALDRAQPGDILWIGPGDYKEHSLRFNGNPATLISTHFASETSLDGDGVASVLAFDQGEQPSTIVDGFHITGAPATADGAVNLLDSAPTLRNLKIARNATSGVVVRGGSPTLIALELQANTGISGGGVAAYEAAITLAGASFIRNRASDSGGGVYSRDSTLTLLDSYFDGNIAYGGGGVSVSGGTALLSGLELTHNIAGYVGGGISSQGADVELHASHLAKNAAGTSGGGIYAYESVLNVRQSALLENYGPYAGGIAIYNSTVSVSNTQLLGNLGVMVGGGIRSDCARLTITHTTVVGNVATLDGGAISHYQCGTEDTLVVSESILAWNAASLFSVSAAPKVTMNVQVRDSILYNPLGTLYNIPIEEDNNRYLDPLFVDFSLDRNPYNDDLHLRPESPARDAGSGSDLDGSPSDLGAYGGPEGDAYSQDQDQDLLYDGWETLYGTDPFQPDAQEDPDGDGLKNLEELHAGTHPLVADSDGDFVSDGAEATGAGDPTDWFQRPGGVQITGRIPQDFPSVQAGIDAIRTQGALDLAAGIYAETLDVALKTVTLHGAGMDTTLIQGPLEGSVVTAIAARLVFSDLAITGGFFSKDSEEEYTNGAGLTVSQSDATLTRVWFYENVAANGAGAAFYKSTGSLTDCNATANESSYDGGGISSFSSTLTVEGGEYADNEAFDGGGGIFSSGGSLIVQGANVTRNTAGSGGGIRIEGGTGSLENLTVTQNKASVGGGISLYYASVSLTDADITHNEAIVGAGLNSAGLSTRIENSLIRENVSTSNAALYGENLSLTLLNVGILENQATDFSGFETYGAVVGCTNLAVIGNVSEKAGAGLRLSGGTQGELSSLHVSGNLAQPGFGAITLEYSSPAFAGAVVASNSAVGIQLFYNSVPSILNSILAYNPEGNLMKGAGQGSQSMLLSYSNLYNPVGLPSTDTTTTNTSNRTLEPQFLSYDGQGNPDNFHLKSSSPLVNTGAPGVMDRDGSKGDLGIYGGPFGSTWDRDQDGLPDYFWPGTLDDAPNGYDQGAYDEDDTDAL